ncbi:MAG TPA: hypothetical protein PKC39_08145 [Ferruginibacter sp.]|nr:hypothetical protein [Ferruginibacter sp.]HMP20915.1 hypothetical protein [Ferruginibacter sp.]
MKKCIVAILALLYLSVSSGIALQIHYCMGKKAGTELFGAKPDKCKKCCKEEKKGCCSDTQKFYKLEDVHKNAVQHFNIEAPVALIHSLHSSYEAFTLNTHLKAAPNNHSPPQYSQPSACIRNCVFRI